MNLNPTAQVRPAFAPRLRRPKGWSKIAAALTILALVEKTLAKDFTTMASINYTHPVQKIVSLLAFEPFPEQLYVIMILPNHSWVVQSALDAPSASSLVHAQLN